MHNKYLGLEENFFKNCSMQGFPMRVAFYFLFHNVSLFFLCRAMYVVLHRKIREFFGVVTVVWHKSLACLKLLTVGFYRVDEKKLGRDRFVVFSAF